MKIIQAVKCGLFGITLALATLSAHSASRIELDRYYNIDSGGGFGSGPWGKVGTDVFSDATGMISASQPYWSTPQSLTISYESFDHHNWVSVDFSADALGIPLQVGIYEGAQRFPFNDIGHPGLDLTNTGSGFNTLDGRFQVFDIQRDSQAQVTSFAASFEIFNYPAPTGQPLTGGRVWFNSEVAIPSVPEPSTWALFFLGAITIAWRFNRRHQ